MFFLAARAHLFWWQCIPVAFDLYCAITLHRQQMTGGQFLYIAEERVWCGRRKKREIVIERFLIDLRCHCRVLKNCLNLRSENEPTIFVVKVKRLHSNPITCERQLTSRCIPKGNRIVTLNFVYKIETSFLVKMQDGF